MSKLTALTTKGLVLGVILYISWLTTLILGLKSEKVAALLSYHIVLVGYDDAAN